MPGFRRTHGSTSTGRWLGRVLAALIAVGLAGCATTLPDPPSGHIDRLPFTLVVPLTGDQTPETAGGPVHAVRWTVLSCPASEGPSRHLVIGTRGTTSASQLPPGALAGLIVCDASDGHWSVRKVNVHQGVDVDRYRYEPMATPSVVLLDNTLEILAFEPGTLVLDAQPESTTGPVGSPHRFEVTIGDGAAWRQSVSEALARMRQEAQATASTGSPAGEPAVPSLLHFQY